ncbi:MAG: SnoaL-like domain-containing protein [Myxococcales bacterium]|nr:SnoaL-like domain-containing protein [Myxococcales bacterium]
MDPDLRLAAIELVDREGVLLDQKDWDGWLELYLEDASYWIPAWDDEHTLTGDPDREISLIYYDTRAGLEDRIFRLRTGHSLASTPLPRTVHMSSSHRVREEAGDVLWVGSNWSTHSYRHGESHTFFGHQEHRLRRAGGQLRIASRKIVVANDRIPNVLDIYSV